MSPPPGRCWMVRCRRTDRPPPGDIQAYLKSLNGQGTVPHVYIQQEFIGGCSDLQAIPESKLKAKISA